METRENVNHAGISSLLQLRIEHLFAVEQWSSHDFRLSLAGASISNRQLG